jgi:hypothetical protein
MYIKIIISLLAYKSFLFLNDQTNKITLYIMQLSTKNNKMYYIINSNELFE